MIPKVKSMMSPALEYGQVPPDPENCRVLIEAEIGPEASEGGDIFSFEACTPKALAEISGPTWAKGMLLVPVFDWKAIEKALHQYLMQCDGVSWQEAASRLSRQLDWEFEDYQENVS